MAVPMGLPMHMPVKVSLQAYQMLLYGRALHPELFPLRKRRVVKNGAYELEVWAMDGAHLLRYEMGSLCSCELLTPADGKLPEQGVITALLAAGERDYEHRFVKEKVTYMTSIQTETLSENLYIATFDEILDYARASDALIHKWEDDNGRSLSVIDTQKFNKEVHVQCYHLVAQGGIVLRTQTIFENVG
jgi:hypothetical protein